MSKKRIICGAASIFLLLVVSSCDNTGPEPPAPPEAYCKYIPTDIGNRWEFRVTEESKFNPRKEYKLIYEIKSTKTSYEGFPKAYVITVTKAGVPTEIIVACEDDKCYLERVMWAYLMEEDLVVGVWTQTGLVVDFPLEYTRDVNVTVPAGNWRCRDLARDNENEAKPEEWHEYYAEGVGLVKYENFYKEYKGSEPPELVDWRNEIHELLSYKIEHTSTGR
jgi:hypothetical protein